MTNSIRFKDFARRWNNIRSKKQANSIAKDTRETKPLKSTYSQRSRSCYSRKGLDHEIASEGNTPQRRSIKREERGVAPWFVTTQSKRFQDLKHLPPIIVKHRTNPAIFEFTFHFSIRFHSTLVPSSFIKSSANCNRSQIFASPRLLTLQISKKQHFTTFALQPRRH